MSVAKKINEEYKNWKQGEIVYISAPTGSGKTEFVLDRLLDHAIENGRKILYLVNREILKRQLQERINSKQHKRVSEGKYINVRNYISVETYQSIEMKNSIAKDHFYIVADECQYFYNDSLFNSNTFLSYSLIISATNSCRIFISATMENIKKYIDNAIPDYIRTYQNEPFRKTMWKTWNYEIEADYSHINLTCVNDISELEQLIVNEKDSKWLVFTDQKESGKKLCENLLAKKCDAIYFDADSEEESEEGKIIGEIVKKQKVKTRIIIVTSVLDNGVSICDSELTRVVVMTDTPEEFLQMLGRKRILDNKEVLNLYVMKKSLSEFEIRKRRYIDRLLGVISQFDINCNYNCGEMLQKCFSDAYYYENVKRIFFVYIDKYTKEYIATINPFSYGQLNYLSEIYSKIIASFEEGDEFSFLRMQAGWIGKYDLDEVINNCTGRKTDINRKVIEEEMEYLCRVVQNNVEFIQEMKSAFCTDKKINKEKIENYKGKVNEYAKELLNENFVARQKNYANELIDLLLTRGVDLQTDEWKSIYEALYKHRLVEAEAFEKVMVRCELPYRMKKTALGTKNKGGFTIYEIYKALE